MSEIFEFPVDGSETTHPEISRALEAEGQQGTWAEKSAYTQILDFRKKAEMEEAFSKKLESRRDEISPGAMATAQRILTQLGSIVTPEGLSHFVNNVRSEIYDRHPTPLDRAILNSALSAVMEASRLR